MVLPDFLYLLHQGFSLYERQRGNLNLPACNKNRARDRRQDRCEIESLLGCESSPKDLQYPIHRGIRRIIGDEVHTVP